MSAVRNLLFATATALLLGACVTAPLHIDTRHESAIQASRVQFLILHYTVADFEDSLDILTGTKRGVSVHYLVSEDPVQVYQLVDESRLARHAGESYWNGMTTLNASSIGIEIVNPGYVDTPEGRVYAPYPQAQIDTVIQLSKDIVARHGIAPGHVLGHADIAPGRKQDPGPMFPWKQLADAGLVPWLDADQVAARLAHYQTQPLPDAAWFQQRLAKVGYRMPQTGEWDQTTHNVLSTFQMKYRPANIDGKPDTETAAYLDVASTPGGLRMLAPTQAR